MVTGRQRGLTSGNLPMQHDLKAHRCWGFALLLQVLKHTLWENQSQYGLGIVTPFANHCREGWLEQRMVTTEKQERLYLVCCQEVVSPGVML